jgi:hypothetical protein
MQMIDVLKRLAELDAKNPNVEKTMVKESTVAECGMMPMPGMGVMSSPSHPPVAANFSINATAATGDEVANMLTQIMTLAGVHKVGDNHMGAEPPAAVMTMEPSAGDSMRSVIDKMNPDADEIGGEEDEEELGPFQGNDDDMSADQGDIDNDGDHDMDDHEAEEEPEKMPETVDSMPADTQPPHAYDTESGSKNDNTPGQEDRMDGNMPRAHPKKESQSAPTFESLMQEYKQFIGESEEVEEDDDMEEGIEDRLKDLDPKNPVNIPAYQRKAASGDSASAAKNTKESANESMADILKLSGLK